MKCNKTTKKLVVQYCSVVYTRSSQFDLNTVKSHYCTTVSLYICVFLEHFILRKMWFTLRY